jgi:MEMO1 family protein
VTVRPPAVAGRFYPGRQQELERDLASYVEVPREGRVRAFGCVVPHAGYMYSGHVAGAVYARLELPARYIILCPNHTGAGHPLALNSEGTWSTPLGEATIDTELATALKARFKLLEEDTVAHRAEHSLEVQLPFLQTLHPGFIFVPICVGTANYEVLAALGETIASAVAATKEPILVIASSDMNHYENDAITRIKDAKAIERILHLDVRGLYDVVHRERISMCGYAPTVAMLTTALRLGATSAELVKYATSGDISGDRDAVVGYAGIVVS